MIKKQFEPYGAQWILTLSGNPADVAIAVNNYANFGMFLEEALPSEYEPGKHSRVTFAVTAARVPKALQSIEEFKMCQDGRSKQFKRQPAVFEAHAESLAESELATFERVSGAKLVDDRNLDGLRKLDKRDEVSPELKARGKALLAGLFGLQREAAKSAARSSAE